MLDREKYNIEREQALKMQITELAGQFERIIQQNLNIRDKAINPMPDSETLQKITDIPIRCEGRDPKAVGDEIVDLILSATTLLKHPRFFSFVAGAVSPYSIAGEILSCLYNPNMGAYQLSQGPMLVEEKLIRWAGERAGIDPKHCGGIFTSGGSLSNLTGMICGREAKLPGRYDLPNAVAFCSNQAHSSIRKGMRLMGLRNDQIVIVDTDESFRIRTDILRKEIENTLAQGKKPFLLVGSCGTTNTGTIDPLKDLADIAREYDLWFHVDGAYGGSILLSDIYKNLARGLEGADSFSWDFHKWALQTYSCSCVVVKDKNRLLDAFSEHPEYLADVLSTEHNDGWDLGIEMSRPARSLKLWYTIQAMGTDLLADVIDYSFFNASIAAKRFAEAEDWELVSKPSCGTINVRYAPKSLAPDLYDRLNERISAELIESGYAYIVTTTLNGKKCLRIITINGNTETADVINMVEKLKEIAESVRAQSV